MDIKPSYNRFLVLVVCVVCSGIMPQLFFKNGFLLSYLLRLGIGSADVLIMLSTLSAIMFCMSVPFAFYADRYGKKTIGLLGSGLMVTGYVIIILAGFSWPLSPFILVFSGIILYSCGLSAQLSGWFALLDPLIPGSVKGSFFGTLRASWQVFAIGCSSLLTYMIRAWDSISAFQVLLGGFTLLLALQALLYMKIPEIHSPKKDGRSLLRILGRFPGLPGYMPFCAYCFLLMVGAGSWPATLGLLEKNVLGFTDD
ncbi:MAG: hypothetical protein MI863_03140, partial [Desulfobacterales bacterium]|nr:hypothetical protein [Desulfobacterales bacterium]